LQLEGHRGRQSICMSISIDLHYLVSCAQLAD